MSQVAIRPNAPASIQAGVFGSGSLEPKIVEGTVVRLCWLCFICAVLGTFSLLTQRLAQPEVRPLYWVPTVWVWSVIFLISVAMAVLRIYRLVSSPVMYRLAMVFQVMVAFGLSFSETAMVMPFDQPVLGVSKVAVWIAISSLLVVNRPGIGLWIAFLSALMWPLAYAVNLYVFGLPPIPPHRLAVWIHVPFIVALVNYYISRRLYAMEAAAEKANELGSYSLIALIGTGGMGEVWRARHRMLARDAAIKLVRADLAPDRFGNRLDVARKRFAREAQAIASLQSPHTVYLFDFGVAREGFYYYVMELLDGISLEMLVQKFGPQPASRVVHILRQVCESLEEAHRRNLVHRDIKPSNIFLCSVGIEYDFAKVLDFGLVKNLSQSADASITTEGISAGTPAYMAPEIAMGEVNIDGRVDLYGLGCVAYFLLTGSPVFAEKTATATALAHVQKTPVPPSQRSEIPIPPLLEQIILTCLAKDPGDRPQSALELSRLLASSGVPEWTQEQASEWWQLYLPVSCAHRLARQPFSDGALSPSTP